MLNKFYLERKCQTSELLEQVEKYLSYDECIAYNRFYYTLNEDLMDHERANKLIELYKKIINLDTNNK